MNIETISITTGWATFMTTLMSFLHGMKAVATRLSGPCPFGHSKDYFSRREPTQADGTPGRMMKECPRCLTCYAVVIGGEMLTTGPLQHPVACAGQPTGRGLVEQPQPKQKIISGRFQ